MEIEKEKNRLGYVNLNINYGVQFTFTTLPDKQEADFQQYIEKDYFEGFRNPIKELKPFLYKPMKYYILGDYDICYITLINNLKFSHRLFEPKSAKNNVFKSHSFQSYSGFALNTIEQLENIQDITSRKFFVGIVNLKLNNGLLLGNGINFYEYVFNSLTKVLEDKPFLISQTFTWFDFSLVVFIDDPAELSALMSVIRGMEVGDNDYDQIIENSLYNEIIKNDKERIKHFSIFSDTHTYFGFNHDLIQGKLTDKFVCEFLQFIENHKIELETEIEWLVKPGHEQWLYKLLEEHKQLGPLFNFEKNGIMLGKYDYCIKQKTSDITISFHLIRDIFRSKCKLFEHIRKVRTRIFLNAVLIPKEQRGVFLWDKDLSLLAIKSDTYIDIEDRLKALKISRQIRLKISKIFINYNNGIQDPIQFTYFLDFTVFIKNLIGLIIRESDNAKEKAIRIRELEDKLNEHIRIFQEGYDVRFLNGYQFENISDFNLDFNSSIPQLLSSYSSLIFEYGKLLYENGEYGQVIQLNNIDTESNYISINYSIHHLTSPEFVFSTILKEILNQLEIDNRTYKELLAILKSEHHNFIAEVNESYLDDMFEHNLFELEYFVMDAIRYMITYQFNFELFNHWFWTYNYQNPSLFDSSGMFNEDHLRKEMLRIMLIRDYFKVEKGRLSNPSPELFTFWDRHIDKIEIISEKIILHLQRFEISKVIDAVFYRFINKLKNTEPPLEIPDIKIDTVKTMYTDTAFREMVFRNILRDECGSVTMRGLIKYFYNTLYDHYEKNSKQVTLLRRDWASGTILKNHIKLYENIFYSIDQTGGVFFYDGNKMDNYFEQNARNLISLLDFSLIQKKKFFMKHLNHD